MSDTLVSRTYDALTLTPHGVRCLVVDANVRDADNLSAALIHEGYDVQTAASGEQALRVAETWKPSIVLLEWELPGIHGPRTAELLVESCDPFIVMVTTRDSEVDRVTTLSTVADDYIIKPYSLAELISRVRAILRRDRCPQSGNTTPTRFTSGGLVLDTVMRSATFRDHPVEFTRLEFDLLACLLHNAPRPVERKALIAAAWGDPGAATTHTLDVHTSRLRHKLADIGASDDVVIESVRGFGLRLVIPRS